MKFFLKSLLTPIVVTIFTTYLILHYIRPWADRPNVKILGALPVHLVEQLFDRDAGVKFAFHRFAIILNVHNDSPFPAVAHVGIIDGCVSMSDNPYAAETNVPPEQRQSFSGKHVSVPFERHKNTVQRIRASGIIRDGPVAVPAYGTEYIGLLFQVEPSGAFWEFTGSVSLEGDCSKIKAFNTRPAYSQLLRMENRHRLRSLRKEMLTGQLKLSLIVGETEISIKPELLKRKTSSILWKRWSKLLFAQMYENPDTNFPPTK